MREWYVISLRPLGRHGGVRRAAAACGARVVALSTLRLESLPATNLAQALGCPIMIVTSPAAARFAQAQADLRSLPGQRWFALGSGTAQALARAGVHDVQIPAAGSDSEALLAQAQLRAVAGVGVGLLTAPGGRGLLAAELQSRGARLVAAEVYRRQVRMPTPARLRALAALPSSSALLYTSEEALLPLWQALDAAGRAHLRQRPCVVASTRLAALAAERGFATVLRADDASPSSLLAALATHAGQRRIG